MLKSTAKNLASGKIILASASPRRREILQNLGLKLDVIPSNFDENLDRNNYKSHGEFVSDLAKHKVNEVYKNLEDHIQKQSKPLLIIGADTIVTKNDLIYGKPKDKQEAFDILLGLSNQTHTVFTGVCLKTMDKEIVFWESTDVTMGNLTENQIRDYIDTGEPLDKAGGYGAQGIGGCLVEKINGDFYTVVGLPLYSTIKHLNELF